jgi:ribonuclease P protein component
VKREFRLTKSTDIERVRRAGKSYAHPLMVLIVAQSAENFTRIGVAAGKSVGNAVNRNRAKRLLRSAVRPILQDITPGWDILLLARKPLATADVHQTTTALRQLLERAFKDIAPRKLAN